VIGVFPSSVKKAQEETMLTPKSAAAALAICSMVLAGNTPAQSHDGYDRHIMLFNNTNQVITEFHASNIGTDEWEEDILGRYRLNPGGSTLMNLDDGSGYCLFDFKTVLADGTNVVRRRVNVCDVSSYTLASR
jgi:hypothetical protein